MTLKLLILFLLSCIAYNHHALAQKGTWQIALEEKRPAHTHTIENLLWECSLAEEIKEYDLAHAFKIAYKCIRLAKDYHSTRLEAEAYHLLGESFRLSGKPFDAIKYHRMSLRLFNDTGKEFFMQRGLRDLAFTYSGLSKFDSTQRVLDLVLQWFQKNEPNTREHAMTLYQIGINTLRMGGYEDAMRYTLEARKIFKKVHDSYNEARTYNNVGLIKKNMGYYTEAVENYLTALACYDRAGKKQRATCVTLINLGNTYLSLRDSTNIQYAQDYFKKSHEISVQIKDTIQIIASVEALAKVEAFQKNFSRAKQYYDQGFALIKKTDNYVEEGYYLMRISDIHASARNFDNAIALTEKALQTFSKHNALEAIAQTQAKLSVYYSHKKSYKISQEYAYKALYNAEKSDYRSIPYLYNILINNAIELKNYEEAADWGKKSIAHFNQVKGTSALLETYKSLIRLDTIQKKPASAVKWYTLYNLLRDSLFVVHKNKDMLELQFKYNIQDQKKENDYLKQVNQLQLVESRQRGVIIMAIGMALLAVLGGAFILYYHRERLKRLLKLVREQNYAIIEKTHEIETQNETLEKLNRTKDKILSVISHDMRSPLANLKAVLSLAQEGVISVEEKAVITEKLNREIGRVYDFLQNLLLWAESQRDGFTPSVETFALAPLVENIFEVIMPQAQQKNLELAHTIPQNLMFATDKDILSMVLLNLASNAVKFTSEAGKVSIEAEHTQHTLRILVKDNGIGIAPEHQEKIFGASRFTTYGTAQEKGTGFGLALCRDFMHALGGNIYFESEVGKGTTFFIELQSLAP